MFTVVTKTVNEMGIFVGDFHVRDGCVTFASQEKHVCVGIE